MIKKKKNWNLWKKRNILRNHWLNCNKNFVLLSFPPSLWQTSKSWTLSTANCKIELKNFKRLIRMRLRFKISWRRQSKIFKKQTKIYCSGLICKKNNQTSIWDRWERYSRPKLKIWSLLLTKQIYNCRIKYSY